MASYLNKANLTDCQTNQHVFQAFYSSSFLLGVQQDLTLNKQTKHILFPTSSAS